jgi:glutaredoxin-like protein NrdH
MSQVVVYTQPHCPACRSVEGFLAERDVEFELRDVLDDAGALEEIAAHGFMSTPVTRIDDRWIAGFDENELERALAG